MGNFPYYSTRSSGQVPFDFRNRAFAPPAFTLVPNAETGEVTAIDPNLRLPLVYEWNTGNTAVEEALGPNQSLSVTYVGAHGMHLLREDTIVKGSTGIWFFCDAQRRLVELQRIAGTVPATNVPWTAGSGVLHSRKVRGYEFVGCLCMLIRQWPTHPQTAVLVQL